MGKDIGVFQVELNVSYPSFSFATAGAIFNFLTAGFVCCYVAAATKFKSLIDANILFGSSFYLMFSF